MNKFMGNTNLLRNSLITIYVLIVLAFSATAKAQMKIMPISNTPVQVQIQSYVGQLAMTLEGQFYLIVSEDKVFELQSNIDLSDFNGMIVSVDGYEVKHKVGPVAELASLDPLPRNNEATVAPLLVVFGISEVSN